MSNRELPTKTKSLGIVRGFEVFNSTRSVPLYFASDARRRLHWGCHPIDDSEARPSTPSRGRTGRIGARGRLNVVPVVRGPDVAGRINGHVSYHLDAAALENVDDIGGLRAGRMPSGVVPGQQRGRTTPHIANPNVIIAVDVQAPRDAFGRTGEAFRGRLGAIGTDHIDRTGNARRWAFDVLNHMVSNELELLHDGYAFGKLRLRCAQIHVARHPDIFLRVQGKGAHADPGPEALHLGGIVGWKTHDRVRRGVGDPDTVLRVDHDVEGRFQPCQFDNAAVLDPSAGKEQQLVVRAISNPDIAVWGDTNAHQSEEFFLEREIALGGDRLTAEIHYKDFPVKAADPDTVFRDGRAPADAVNAHAGEAGDRRGERGPVR